MEIAAAKRAGTIAAAIEARQAMLEKINQCIAQDWRVYEVRARNLSNGAEASLILGALDGDANGQSLAFIKSVYEAQVAALQADLAVAETWTPPVDPPAE